MDASTPDGRTGRPLRLPAPAGASQAHTGRPPDAARGDLTGIVAHTASRHPARMRDGLNRLRDRMGVIT
ncbi:hypothetical protein [Streptomyces sp. NPDC101132]|uniref:hypothetical protein n=1 Tax=Streptomyces sp. NPDC101132 TaxID=3366110 RepID=UPI00380DFFEB